MLKNILICLIAISHGIYGRPSQQVPGDLASHILIVTPQAQVHLEPAFKYDSLAPSAFIQHLSPLARIAAPHEETIIYVPSGGAVDHNSVNLARSAFAIAEPLHKQESKQYEQISQQIEQAQAAIQQGTSAIGPQLSEAASAAASAASNAGSGFFPALFPPAAPAAPAASANLQKIEYEALSAAPLLMSSASEGRRFYALTPAVSHVIDFVHAPVFVGSLSAVRARSIRADNEEKEKLMEALPLPSSESIKSEPPVIEMLLEKKKPELAAELPKLELDRMKLDINKGETSAIKEEKKKYVENVPFEKMPLEKQLKKEEPAKKEFIEKEKEQFQAELKPQEESLERRDEAKEYKVSEIKQSQERKEQLKEYKEPEVKAEELKPLQAEELKPLEAKEKFLEKPELKEVKELKEIREEFKKEEKPAEEPQPQQQLLKDSFKSESIKAVEGPNYNKIAAVIPEKQEEPKIDAQSLRASSGRIDASEVVPVHAHVHHEEIAQQQKSVVVPIDQPGVPVFIPQLKAV